MFPEVALHIVLIAFFAMCLWEDSLKPKRLSIGAVRKRINALPVHKILLCLFYVVAIVGLLLMTGNRDIVSIYLSTSFSFLVILHALWLSWRLKNKILHILPQIVILLRVLFPSNLTHNVFVFLSVVWLG